MRDYLANEVRNVVVLGHSGSGKTAVIEACMKFTGLIEKAGRNNDGTSALDYDAEEGKRGTSCYCHLAPVEWKNKKINFIDTPGYMDYAGEEATGLYVGDNALIVVNGKEGIESGTERAWKEVVRQRKLPTIFFVNKIDDEHANFDEVLASLREKFGNSVIPFEMPIEEDGKVVGSVNILRKKAWYHNNRKQAQEVPDDLKDKTEEYYAEIAEAIAMTDDELLEKFSNGEEFDEHELAKGLRIGVRSGDIRPVYSGSAIEETGIERLMDLITEYFPSYAEKGHVSAESPRGRIDMETNEDEALSAFVFKTIVDPFVGKISYLKVMSGILNSDSEVYNSKKDVTEKINQIYAVNGKYQIALGKLFTGDIGAVVKLQSTETNDTLCTRSRVVYYDGIDYPQPMLGYAVWPKTKADEDKMSVGIRNMEQEDGTLRYENNEETHEQVLYGLGDQHISLICAKLKAKYKVDVNLTEPTVQYRETIRGKAEAQGRYKKQNGGAGMFGDVWVRFEPAEDSEEMVFAEEVFGGAVPKQYFPPVEQGLRECMQKGVLAGYKVVGVKATLYDGSYHPVDSKEAAFKEAARLAYNEGMPKAKPVLLEPIGEVTITAPESYTGTVIGDLTKRRGSILEMNMNEDGEQVIVGEVPMREMLTYANELRSMTQGRGSYVIAFDRYEPAPKDVADAVIEAAKQKNAK